MDHIGDVFRPIASGRYLLHASFDTSHYAILELVT